MRRLLLRSTLSFALAWTAACADDVPTPVSTTSSTGEESSSGPGPVSADTTAGQDTTEGPATTDASSSGGSSDGGSSDGGSSDGGSSGDSSGGPVCGNDMVEGSEPCDGADLARQDCTTLGFDAGTLACLDDCSDFDTSACINITCGDDVIDGADVCDGTDLGGNDCTTQGFDAGTLACAADCTAFDTTGCITFSCGNDLTEGIEACDGTDLLGQTCVTLGFDGGTLACNAGCDAFDTTGCYACGDGVVAGPEACDGMDLAGQTCATEGFDGGTLACTGTCTLDTSGCTTCGDDLAEGAEVCDGTDLLGEDCASQGFDGGTLACAAGCGAYDTAGCYACGDGVAAGPEACDGADLLGEDCDSQGFDGGTLACSATCDLDTSACTTCGDGVIAGGEQCEGANLGGQTCTGLGFAFGSLGCNPGCGFNQSHCVNITSETEPNDDGAVAVATNDFSAANANGPFTTDTLISAAINPAGDDDVFAISNPGPGYTIVSLETFGPVLGACDLPTDTQIFLLTSTGLQLATNDEGGINSCSLLTNIIIPPGLTLYVRVIDFGDNTAIPGYHLHIRFDPVVCGDGVAGPGEQCDDGGVAPGDGCSATCSVEGVIQEIEPNGTSAQADANGIVIANDAVLGGVIGPALGDLDRYRIQLAAPQFVRFETFTSVGRCDPGIATTLRLFDAAGTQIIADAGPLNGSGILTCAGLVFPLPAGTFYVQVEETGNNSLIPTYLLQVELLGDAGIETEPNEDQASASLNLTGGVSDVYVFGDHAVQADSDYYAIDVPVAGSSLRLEIMEGDRAVETCESNGIDSRLTLYNAAGTQLVDDDDDGRGFCSHIDGTGATGQDAAAHNLAAGTYFVQVRASTFAQATAAGQFTYRLVATVRQP